MVYDMNDCVILDRSGMAKEEVSASRFATLENEVKHQGDDIAEIKKSTKNTEDAVNSIQVSLATLTMIAEQNNKLEPRLERLEKKVDSNGSKIAAASGAATAIGLFIGYLAKLKGLFG
ncbi:hypothetical protein pA_gene0024 [Vibrio phage 13VT501A]|nr:hypothetical protein pA_gene0024 [Vibrio phage 13VT501A]